jgi:DNA-binding transcriptional ArsR family regulator
MSRASADLSASKRRHHAAVFAALGDETRLSLLTALSAGEPRSIAELTGGARMSRQALTKHLRVLESAGLLHSTRTGRQSLFAFNPAALQELRDYLQRVCEEWDQALSRLKSLVEG